MILQGATNLPAYQLPCNPFPRRPLMSLESDGDHDCFSMVDGWKGLDVAAESFIAKKVSDEKPVHFVLVGADKTGRTSIANYLVRLWANRRGGKDAVVVNTRDPGANSGTYSIEGNMIQWAQEFLALNIVKNLGLAPSTLDCLRRLSPSNWNPSLMSEALANLEHDFRNSGQNGQQRFLAAIFEHGRGDELVMKIKDSFKHTQAIVVTTIDDTGDSGKLVSSVVDTHFDGLALRLRPIQGADVVTLIKHQWERVGNGMENPFDLTAVEDVFDSPRPIGRVVGMLAWLLDNANAAHGGVAPWPSTRTLAFGEEALRAHVRNYDLELQSARR